jgi:hypothetical protein
MEPNFLMIIPTPMPSATPRTPPIAVTTIASDRNCERMSRCRAPVAIRTPISRVRSVTETSMMFMTPMPPTSSAMPPIEASKSRNWFCVAATVSSSSALLTMRKSSSPPCSDVMKLRNSSCVSLIRPMSSTAT